MSAVGVDLEKGAIRARNAETARAKRRRDSPPFAFERGTVGWIRDRGDAGQDLDVVELRLLDGGSPPSRRARGGRPRPPSGRTAKVAVRQSAQAAALGVAVEAQAEQCRRSGRAGGARKFGSIRGDQPVLAVGLAEKQGAPAGAAAQHQAPHAAVSTSWPTGEVEGSLGAW